MRLFIAVNFGEAVRARLLALRDELRESSSRGNFSAPENLHLILLPIKHWINIFQSGSVPRIFSARIGKYLSYLITEVV